MKENSNWTALLGHPVDNIFLTQNKFNIALRGMAQWQRHGFTSRWSRVRLPLGSDHKICCKKCHFSFKALTPLKALFRRSH